MTLPTSTINAEIAQERGWTKEPVWNVRGSLKPGYLWTSPGEADKDKPLEARPPNFCASWEHAGPLWERLWKDAWDEENEVGPLVDEVEIIQTELGCDLTEAITRAYHAAFVEGKR